MQEFSWDQAGLSHLNKQFNIFKLLHKRNFIAKYQEISFRRKRMQMYPYKAAIKTTTDGYWIVAENVLKILKGWTIVTLLCNIPSVEINSLCSCSKCEKRLRVRSDNISNYFIISLFKWLKWTEAECGTLKNLGHYIITSYLVYYCGMRWTLKGKCRFSNMDDGLFHIKVIIHTDPTNSNKHKHWNPCWLLDYNEQNFVYCWFSVN